MIGQWRHVGVGVRGNPRAQQYVREGDGLAVIVGHESGRWHISISVERGYPTWDQIADARYHFISDQIDMALILPPLRDYINLAAVGGPEVFHLWEIRDPELPIERGGGMPRTGEDRQPR